jgi:hypothetical protein
VQAEGDGSKQYKYHRDVVGQRSRPWWEGLSVSIDSWSGFLDHGEGGK